MRRNDPDTPERTDASTPRGTAARQLRELTRASERDPRLADALSAAGPIPPAALAAVAAIFETLFEADSEAADSNDASDGNER